MTAAEATTAVQAEVIEGEAVSQPQAAPQQLGNYNEATAPKLYDRVGDPNLLDFINKLGGSIHGSGMFGTANLDQGRMIIFFCLANKMNPLDFAKKYHIIKGKITMRADAMLAEFHARGGKVDWKNIGDDGQEAKAKFTPLNGKSYEMSYSLAEAQIMGAVKPDSNWVKFPGAMLRARLISKALRIIAPEIIAGCYTPEEAEDFVDRIPKGGQTNGAASQPRIEAPKETSPVEVAAESTTGPIVDASVEPVAKPAEPTPPTPPAPAPTPDPNATLDQPTLDKIAAAKKEIGYSPEQWKRILTTSFKVNSARELTQQSAELLLTKMEQKIAAKKQSGDLKEWSEQQVPDSAMAGSQASTENPDAEPPFE